MTWTCNQSSPDSSRAPHTLGTHLGSWDDTWHGAGLSSACCWTDRAQLGTARDTACPSACCSWVSLCPQSLAGSRGDPRPCACPSSPGLGAQSQLQATQEPSSRAHCSIVWPWEHQPGSRQPLCPGRGHTGHPQPLSLPPNPANSPPR